MGADPREGELVNQASRQDEETVDLGEDAHTDPDAALPWGLGLAAGAMIYVVTAEIIPETRKKSKGEGSMIGLMIGLVGMMFLDIALG